MQRQMIVLTFLGNQCTKFPSVLWNCLYLVALFGVVYLVRRDFVMHPTASLHQILCRPRKGATETRATTGQDFEEESISVHGVEKSKLTETEVTTEQV